MNSTTDTEMEKVIQECIKVIESTNLGDIIKTTYDISLVEAARQRYISNIEKRFDMKSTNF